jgi:uncharacterized protein involved in exopolysaccharide biosynthesis
MSNISLPASPARQEARQQINELQASLAQASQRLGNSHSLVEKGRLDLKALRQHEKVGEE